MFRQIRDLLGSNRRGRDDRSRGQSGLLGRILGGGSGRDRYDDRRRSYDDDDDDEERRSREYGSRRRRRGDDDDD